MPVENSNKYLIRHIDSVLNDWKQSEERLSINNEMKYLIVKFDTLLKL